MQALVHMLPWHASCAPLDQRHHAERCCLLCVLCCHQMRTLGLLAARLCHVSLLPSRPWFQRATVSHVHTLLHLTLLASTVLCLLPDCELLKLLLHLHSE
jgi:hypothetical protein